MSTRVLGSMLAVTIVLQMVVLYKQNRGPARPSPIQEPASNVELDVAGMPFMGSVAAELMIVEFGDYECPFCQKHATGVLPMLKEKYVSTGKVRYAFANLPLAVHKNAVSYASAAICAGRQQRYWEMHDALFATPFTADRNISLLARQRSIDSESLEECLTDEPMIQARLQRDLKEAARLGISSTPYFALGRSNKNGTLHVLKTVRGAQPMSAFDIALESIGL